MHETGNHQIKPNGPDIDKDPVFLNIINSQLKVNPSSIMIIMGCKGH